MNFSPRSAKKIRTLHSGPENTIPPQKKKERSVFIRKTAKVITLSPLVSITDGKNNCLIPMRVTIRIE